MTNVTSRLLTTAFLLDHMLCSTEHQDKYETLHLELPDTCNRPCKNDKQVYICRHCYNHRNTTMALVYQPTVLKVRYSEDPLLGLVLGVKTAYVRNNGPSE